MSGQWPSGWDDPADEELDTGEPDEGDVRRSEVAAFLATVPAPVLPGAIEARIAAALAAESAARAAGSADKPTADKPTADKPAAGSPEPDRSRTLGPAPARARVRRFRRLRPAQVTGTLLACLLFVGLGFVISLSHGGSSSSSMASAPQAVGNASASGTRGFSSAAAGSSAGRSVAVGPPVIVITRSGTAYRAATLAGQVRSAIATLHAEEKLPGPATPSFGGSSPASASAASSPASVSGGALLPTSILRGCVLHLTGNVPPLLVDRASYQGTPAYVIASGGRVWVVGLGCTATRPDVIASASLTG